MTVNRSMPVPCLLLVCCLVPCLVPCLACYEQIRAALQAIAGNCATIKIIDTRDYEALETGGFFDGTYVYHQVSVEIGFENENPKCNNPCWQELKNAHLSETEYDIWFD